MKADLPELLQPQLPPDGLTIKIIGLGGVGEKVARYGCMQWANLNAPCRVVLIDFDSFEPSNASRMGFSRPGPKASVVRQDLLPFVANSQLTLLEIEQYLTKENAGRLVKNNDVIFCCVDNHQSRKILTDHVRTLHNCVVISGGNDGVEIRDGKQRRGTFGTVQIWIRQNGVDLTPDLARYHPEIASPADRHPNDKSCSELMTSVPQLVLTNLAVASAMLNAFYLLLCNALHYSELVLEIAEGRMQPVLPIRLLSNP
ncbi:MAG: ThiF family adenylyltransferase [Lentisphaerae bacterium]|nr:ThiF family adenylyltransferase [Lentisphaerota bacterium]